MNVFIIMNVLLFSSVRQKKLDFFFLEIYTLQLKIISKNPGRKICLFTVIITCESGLFSEPTLFYSNGTKYLSSKKNIISILEDIFRLLGAYFSLCLAGKCTLEMDPLRKFIHLCLAKTKHVFPRFSRR